MAILRQTSSAGLGKSAGDMKAKIVSPGRSRPTIGSPSIRHLGRLLEVDLPLGPGVVTRKPRAALMALAAAMGMRPELRHPEPRGIFG